MNKKKKSNNIMFFKIRFYQKTSKSLSIRLYSHQQKKNTHKNPDHVHVHNIKVIIQCNLMRFIFLSFYILQIKKYKCESYTILRVRKLFMCNAFLYFIYKIYFRDNMQHQNFCLKSRRKKKKILHYRQLIVRMTASIEGQDA